jgi:hypothetical protein
MAITSVLLLDFDNIISGLWGQDVQLALDFANRPMEWLPRLTQSYLGAADSRRLLVARCYLNPAGWRILPGRSDERVFYSRFRPGLVSAGFEVVDCPAMTRTGKNAADIRIVIDALDLLYHRSDYEEFIVASGDSDFTPLLQRIRADNRRITVISPGLMSPAYASLADQLIDFAAIETLVRGSAEPTVAAPAGGDSSAQWAAFDALVRTRYAEAAAPLNLASLAQEVAVAVPEATANNWFGKGFASAVQSLGLPNAEVAKNFLWDEERHQPPEVAQPDRTELSESLEMLVRVLDLPRLRKEAWPAIFETLERYAAEHDFSLTEATKWSRDQLAGTGTPIGRPAIGYVVKGTQIGGVPLNSDPAPKAADIARGFSNSLIDRAYQAGINLDPSEVEEISAWFGVEPDPPAGEETT